jgi:glycosyltransferase involved in cell wall biosynthesis
MSRIPVILPAYNEERLIARALDSMPADLVEPIVAVNGSTDSTASIAESFGAKVYNFEEQGKLPAIQSVLKSLGNRALEPLLILDSDNKPVFPRGWANGMLKALLRESEQPVFVGGPVWYTGSGLAYDAMRSIKRFKIAHKGRDWQVGMQHGQVGPNTGINLQNEGTLEAILAMPHYWPGEDRAMMDTIVDRGGSFYQPVSPKLMTLTPSSVSFLPLSERLSLGHEEATKKIIDRYIERGADDSVPYLPKITIKF